MAWIGQDDTDPREIEEFRRGTSRETKEEFNKYLENRNLEVSIINGHVCLIPKIRHEET